MAAPTTKRATVKFVGDDEVLKHIVDINQRKSSLKLKINTKKKSVTYIEDENEEEIEEDVCKPSQALCEDEGIVGREVFSFRTPKKSGQMAQKALATTPKTPKTPKTPSRTPKSALKRTPSVKSSDMMIGETPRSRRSLDMSSRVPQVQKIKKPEAMTPYRLRRRNEVEYNQDISDESLSSSDSEDDFDDVENEATENTDPQSNVSTPRQVKSRSVNQVKGRISDTPKQVKGRSRKVLNQEIQPEQVEDYFLAQSGGTITSDRTLARLDTPRMDQEALNAVLSNVLLGYQEERQALHQDYARCFKKWMLQMCNGFNLLLHGLGSKRKLMEEFRLKMLRDFSHIVINGYFPSLTIKSILNSITEEVIEHSGNFRSPIDQCEFIRKHFETGDYEDFYMIIHNIDGSMLRTEKVQAVLSLLAQVRGFHFIASIDHINAPLIWDQNKASRFNWLWYDVTTFEPYTEETSYENSLLVQQTGVLALSSLTHVFKSLTPNSKGVFILLAKYQLDNQDNHGYIGLAFQDLYQKCREDFLVNSELTLRTHMTEFKDHKLIRMKKGMDGAEYLIIPLDAATLKEFMEQQEENS